MRNKYILFFESESDYTTRREYSHFVSMLKTFNKKMDLGIYKLELYKKPNELETYESQTKG